MIPWAGHSPFPSMSSPERAVRGLRNKQTPEVRRARGASAARAARQDGHALIERERAEQRLYSAGGRVPIIRSDMRRGDSIQTAD